MSLVPILVFLNAVVYALWFVRPDLMAEHFLVSWDAILDGRVWVLLTSVFSHNLLWHLLLNMLVLRGFGTAMEDILGRTRFLALYLSAGIAGSLSHAMVSAFVIGEPGLPALGASGAISGLILAFSLTFPKVRIFLFGFIPMPALVGSLIFVGLDVWGLSAQARGGGLPIGHGAHLGGALCGALWYIFLIRPRRRRWEAVAEIA